MDDEMIKSALTLVEDEVKGFLVEHTPLGHAAKPIFALLKALIWHQWEPAVNEFELNLAEALEKYKAKDREYVARLQRSLRRGEASALATELVQAAARATTEERMKMLAAAAAGVLTPDLDSEMRSRVTRAVEQLEPSDVIALRRVSEAVARGENVQQVEGTPQNRIALVQSGCLNIAAGAGYRSLHEPTPLGAAVLKALEAWPRVPSS